MYDKEEIQHKKKKEKQDRTEQNNRFQCKIKAPYSFFFFHSFSSLLICSLHMNPLLPSHCLATQADSEFLQTNENEQLAKINLACWVFNEAQFCPWLSGDLFTFEMLKNHNLLLIHF